QQVVGVPAIDTAPTKVIGKPGRIRASNQLLQAAEVLAIERLGRAEIHGHAMLHDGITFQDLVQDVQRPAAFHHEVFRDDFKPVDNRFLFKNMLVMRDAQPDAYAVVLISVETICGHMTYVVTGGGPGTKNRGPAAFHRSSYV